jgi:diaminopimelate epimerase
MIAARDPSPAPVTPIPFRKMHGLGNDFVVIDARGHAFPASPALLGRIADRRLGVGCDQLILLEPSDRADARMRIFNPDGGEVGACGNATRCVAWLLAAEAGRAQAAIETRAGLLRATLAEDVVTVDMGAPRLGWAEIPLAGAGADTARVAVDAAGIDPALPGWFSAVNMGNPHAVFFVEDCEAFELARIGPALEAHPLFPEKANVSLASRAGPDAFRVRVWERAAGATLACGTAACAVAVAAWRLGFVPEGAVRVLLPGGALTIARGGDDSVLMTGPVATSFTGTLDPALLTLPEAAA